MARSVKTKDGLNNPTEGTKTTTLVAQLEEPGQIFAPAKSALLTSMLVVFESRTRKFESCRGCQI